METDLDFAGYELPIFLEDQTGLLTGSVFLDLYNRQKISYLCLSDDSDSDSMSTTIYGIFNRDNPRIAPDIILEFGADNSLGTIKLGKSDAVAMDDYLPRVSSSARCDIFVFSLCNDCFLIPSSSKSRHFAASNGERYQWKHCQELDQEWAVSLFFFFHPKDRWRFNPWDSAPIAKEKSFHTIVWNFTESQNTNPLDACSPSKETLLLYPVVKMK